MLCSKGRRKDKERFSHEPRRRTVKVDMMMLIDNCILSSLAKIDRLDLLEIKK